MRYVLPLKTLPPFEFSSPHGCEERLYSGASKSGGKKAKEFGKKKMTNATLSLETLQNIKESSHAEHGRPKRTRDNYAGYIEQGKTFLEGLIAKRQENVRHIHNSNLDDNININMLAKAFDNPPNKYSVMVLELYLVQKCLTENISKIPKILSRLRLYWLNMLNKSSPQISLS